METVHVTHKGERVSSKCCFVCLEYIHSQVEMSVLKISLRERQAFEESHQ
jgi:hypothetical protein